MHKIVLLCVFAQTIAMACIKFFDGLIYALGLLPAFYYLLDYKNFNNDGRQTNRHFEIARK